MLGNLPYALLTVVGIGFIIFVHELGHYLAARAVGIRVEAFSIGFGKRLFGWTSGPTEYKVCLIPLGGYVKMAGEDPTRPTTGQPDEFGSKKVWQRVLVISAGVIMNMIFALIAIPLAFSIGIPFEAPVIGGVTPGGPAWEAGLRVGDRVVSIDDRTALSFETVVMDLAVTNGPVELLVEREGEQFAVSVEARDDEDRGVPVIGIRPAYTDVALAEEALDPDEQDKWGVQLAATLTKTGLTPRDKVVAFNGVPNGEGRWLLEEQQRVGFGDEPTVLSVIKAGEHEPQDMVFPAVMGPLESDEERLQIGVRIGGPIIDRVLPGTAASKAGLGRGDILMSIDGQTLQWASDIPRALGGGRHVFSLQPSGPLPNPSVAVMVARGESVKGIEVQLPTVRDRQLFADSLAFKQNGLVLWVHPGGPAHAAGMLSGDRVRAIGGRPVSTFTDLSEAVKGSGGKPLAFEVTRRGNELTFEVQPRATVVNHGVPLLARSLPMHITRFPVGEAISVGFTHTGRMVRRIGQTLGSIFRGSVSSRHLGGIITIFTQAKQRTQVGLMRGLLFLAMVSINLAILNILPIPVLDGGWLVFLIIEKIKGSPVNERTMGYFQWAGLVFILGLMVYVTWNDIARLAGWM